MDSFVRTVRGIVIILSAFFAQTTWGKVGPLDYWTWANPQVNGNDIYGIAKGNGTYVAVGDWGTTLTSSDGSTWLNKSLPVSTSFNCVTFGNGIFVAYAADGSSAPSGYSVSYFLTSKDGENWNSTYAKANPSLYGRTAYIGRIIWANGMFVAVGGNNSFVEDEKTCWIMTSPNGTNWTTQISGPGLALYAITYAQGQFVAVGNNGVSMTSTNGVNWSTSVTTVNGYGEWVDVLYWDGRFVALANTGYLNNQSGVFTSTNGLNWEVPDTSITGYRTLRRLTVHGDKLLATGEQGATFVTSDATNWLPVDVPVSDSYVATTIDGRTLLGGGQGTILNGAEGEPWSSFPSYLDGLVPRAMASDGRSFVALGTGPAAWSPDGRSWSTSSVPGNVFISSAIYARGKFVAVGADNTILTSTNGRNWQMTYTAPGLYHQLQSIAFSSNLFVALGFKGYSLTSTDGVAWQSHQTAYGGFIVSVAAGAGLFAASFGSDIMTSPDGVDWTLRTNTYAATGNAMLKAGAYGFGRFVFVGDSGIAWISTNGMDWSHTTVLDGWGFSRIVFTGRSFVAGGDGGLLFSSEDGFHWKQHFLPAHDQIIGLAFGNDSVLVGGANGMMLRSDPIDGPVRTIRSIGFRPGKRVCLDLLAEPGSTFEIQEATSLGEWNTVGRFTSLMGRMAYEEDATNAAGFSRVLLP